MFIFCFYSITKNERIQISRRQSLLQPINIKLYIKELYSFLEANILKGLKGKFNTMPTFVVLTMLKGNEYRKLPPDTPWGRKKKS